MFSVQIVIDFENVIIFELSMILCNSIRNNNDIVCAFICEISKTLCVCIALRMLEKSCVYLGWKYQRHCVCLSVRNENEIFCMLL